MREIYLDNSATTMADPDAIALAADMMRTLYGNPSSLHAKGFEAQKRLDHARAQVAAALGCDPREIIFTSGGTEANNLALLGALRSKAKRGGNIVACAGSHASVLEPLRELERLGFELRLIPLCPDGNISAADFIATADSATVLVSCTLVNSETGALAPAREIFAGVKRKSPAVLRHCDAVQQFCKLPMNARSLDADLISVSGHKIHAPKGSGALFVRRGVRLTPLLFGGGQEQGLRAGTEAVPTACAFGLMAATLSQNLAATLAETRQLCEYFVNIAREFDGLCMNSPANATPYIYNISLTGYRSEILLHSLAERGVYVSSGSACSGGKRSHVLESMGLPPHITDSALRVSFSRHNTRADVDAFFACLRESMATLTH